MAAGAGYIEFATGDILTAAAANQYLASQVVMVFASASARTSAIASPQEGMISYLKDTNATEYYSGSAWVAIGGSSGALTLITTVNLSSSGSFNINGCFSSTYDNYMVVFSNLQGSSSSYASFGLRSGGTNATSSYETAGYYMLYSSSTINGQAATGDSKFDSIEWGTSTTDNSSGNLFLFSPFKTTNTGFEYNQEAPGAIVRRSGNHAVATSYDSLWFTVNSGTVSGNISIYGLGK